MRAWRGASGGPIGIDLGQRPVCAAQWAGRPGDRRLVRLASIDLPGPVGTLGPEDARRLRQGLGQAGLTGRQAVLAMSESMLLSSIMELPSAAVGVPTSQLARMEMGRLHGADGGAVEMVCWTLPRPARAANTDFVMAVACRCDQAEALLDAVEHAGLRVLALRSRMAGLLGACAAPLGGVNGVAGVLDVTLEQAKLTLLHEGTIVYERVIPEADGEALAAALAQSAGRDLDSTRAALLAGQAPPAGQGTGADPSAIERYADRLVEGARLPLTYVSNQYPDAPLEVLLVTGLASAAPGVAATLGKVCPCNVRAFSPADAAGLSDRAQGPALIERPQMTVAIGLGAWDED